MVNKNIFILALLQQVMIGNEEVLNMGENKFLGSIFNDNCAILFFILVFLLLFVSPWGNGYCDPK